MVIFTLVLHLRQRQTIWLCGVLNTPQGIVSLFFILLTGFYNYLSEQQRGAISTFTTPISLTTSKLGMKFGEEDWRRLLPWKQCPFIWVGHLYNQGAYYNSQKSFILSCGFVKVFLYIFLAGKSVLATPLLLSPILRDYSNPQSCRAVASRRANNLATNQLTNSC